MISTGRLERRIRAGRSGRPLGSSLGSFALLALASALLAACGGGGSGGDDAPPDGTTFPLRSAFAAALKKGTSGAFIVSGYCNGTASEISEPAVPAVFGATSGYAVVTRENISLGNCTPSHLSSTLTSYYDAQYNPVGFVSSAGWSGVYSATNPFPEAVRAGDSASLGRITYYSDPARLSPTGYDEVSFRIEPESSASVIFNRIIRSYAVDGTPQQTDQERSRLTASGPLTVVSAEFQSHVNPEQHMRLTPTTTSPPLPTPSPAAPRPPSPPPPPPPSPPSELPPVSTPDTTQPSVLSVSPMVGAASVPLRSAIRVEFSEALNPASVSLATFSLEANGVPVPGTVTYSGTTATFRPAAPLRGGAVHTARLTTGIEDASGNSLALARTWSFTTVMASQAAALGQAVTYQVDHAHTGSVAFGSPLALPGSPTWSVTLPGQVSYPLIAGGRVYVTTSGLNGGYGTQLHALDVATGTVAWGPAAIPGVYFSSGIAYDQGKVFVLNDDGLLRTFDAATGAEGWSIKLPLQYAFRSPPVALDGVVYASGAGSGGSVYAIDASNGRLMWHSRIATDSSSPAVQGDGVFVSYSCQIEKLDAYTGSSLWIHKGDCSTGGGGRTLVVANGSVYARDVSGGSGALLDPATGVPTGTFEGGWPSSIPAVSGQTEFHLVSGTLRAVDVATRNVRWSFAGDGLLAAAPLVIDETVVIGSGSGLLYAIDGATGTPTWSASAGAAITEYAPNGQTGMAAGQGYLIVPAGNVLTAWKLRP